MATGEMSSKQKGPAFAVPGWLALPVSVVVVLGFYALLLLASNDDLDPGPELDVDLCPVAHSEAHSRAVLLLDLRKPFGEHAHLPAAIVRRVANAIDGGTELQTFALGASAAVPRTWLARLCKPFRNDDLAVVAAKDGGRMLRDCDDLPAQMPPATRERAVAFCRRRDELARRVDRLAAASAALRETRSAHLVEAIEQTRMELDGHARPAIYILSDMMQHSSWYSHLAHAPGDWDYGAFVAARSGRPAATSGNSDLNVTVFYLPGRVTEDPAGALAHKAFWRRYFDGVGTLAFHDQTDVLADRRTHLRSP